jgi:chromosomal replication initiation ATPase DnaA
VAFWTKAEEEFVRKCTAANIAVEAYAPMLGRSAATIRMKRHKLGIRMLNRTYHIADRGEASVAEIKAAVAEYFGIPLSSMDAPDRTRKLARPRQIAMFLSREVALKSYPRIGGMFGGRDHTTVIHAFRQVTRLMAEDHDVKDAVTTIRKSLVSSSPAIIVDRPHFPAFAENRAGA